MSAEMKLLLKRGIKQIIDGRELSETFNKHYVNIVEKSWKKAGKKLTHVACDNNIFGTDQRIELMKQSFPNHSSINPIKQSPSIPRFPYGNEICLTTPNKILKLLKEIDNKKTVGFGMIPPKLVRTAAHVLCSPLSKAINNSLLQGVFPDDAKIALVFPLDKGTSKTNETSNLRPVSILTRLQKGF